MHKHMINYWIQKSDYSSEEWNNVSKDEVVEAFKAFDWASEIEKSYAADESKNCPPGIGIDVNGVLLHICPKDSESVFFNYHYVKSRKLLGLIPSSRKSIHYVNSFPISEVEILISHHVTESREKILAIKY